MFLRRIVQKRKGQTYTYYALSENARTADGRVRQRTVCYLGRRDNLRPPDWLRVAERLPEPARVPVLMAVGRYTPQSAPGPTLLCGHVTPSRTALCAGISTLCHCSDRESTLTTP